MTRSGNIKKKLKWIGYIIMIICFYYISRMIFTLDIDFISIVKNPLKLLCLILYSLFFVIVLYIGAWGWKLILDFLSEGYNLNYSTVSRVYVKANIAKYLPGNFMHFAGRNILGNKLGWKHSTMVFCTFLEIGILIFTSASLSLIFNHTEFINLLLQLFKRIPLQNMIIIFGGLGLIIILLMIYLFQKKFIIGKKINLLLSKNFAVFFPRIYLLYIINFVIQGFMFLFIFITIAEIDINGGYLFIIGSYILAWVIGFITPGSPGGLGVRESVLILLISPAYGKAPVLTAALVNRFASIMGDILAFFLHSLLENFIKKSTELLKQK